MFSWGIMKKTVKELRKKQGFTAHELAAQAKVDAVQILDFDNTLFKDVPEPLFSKIKPYLDGSYMDKIPW